MIQVYVKLFEKNKKWTHACNAFLSCGIAKKGKSGHMFRFFSQNDKTKPIKSLLLFS